MEALGCIDTTTLNSTLYSDLTNFCTFRRSLLTLFQLFVQNNWNEIMDAHIQAGTMWAAVYFISFNLLVVIFVANVLLTMVVDAYGILTPPSPLTPYNV
jgi:hypothetical protein